MPDISWSVLAIVLVVMLVFIYRPSLLSKSRKQENLSQDYFKGVNYLLNEQTDKAIEIFTRMLEVEKETVEIHLALGNLFRRRGEVERSIRIHQSLISEAGLSNEQHAKALLELANDFLRAGLLDRAEALLLDLVETKTHTKIALELLADIYEREKDWQKAIAVTTQLAQTSSADNHKIMAHYYCELAAIEQGKGNTEKAKSLLLQVSEIDVNCVRASLMLGLILIEQKKYVEAINTLKNVASQNPEYLDEVIDPLQQSYAAINDSGSMLQYLQQILPLHNSTRVILMIAELLRANEGDLPAVDFVAAQLKQKPTVRGVDWLLTIEHEGRQQEDKKRLTNILALTGKMLEDHARYKCQHCGFSGRVLYWQCPGCRKWGTVKPRQSDSDFGN